MTLLPSMLAISGLASATLATLPLAPGAGPEPTVLITGSSRGIGFELARQYAARGWRVIATARDPGHATPLQELAAQHVNVRPEQLDVVDPASVAALAVRLKGVPIDVLLNNAGTTDEFSGQSFGKLAHDRFMPLMELNAHAPIRVSEALIENVRAGRQKKIVVLSSLAGSLGAKAGGMPGGYWYKSSKAALNMLMLSLAQDLSAEGISVACLSPGQVDTHGAAARGIRMAGVVEIERSVAGLIEVIDKLTPDTSGRFIRYNGEVLPW